MVIVHEPRTPTTFRVSDSNTGVVTSEPARYPTAHGYVIVDEVPRTAGGHCFQLEKRIADLVTRFCGDCGEWIGCHSIECGRPGFEGILQRIEAFTQQILRGQEQAKAEPQHDFSIKRGRAKFCARCGGGIVDEYLTPCVPQPFDQDYLRWKIENQIGDLQRDDDRCHRPPSAPRSQQPAWSNISAALTIVGGWNRRAP